VFVTTLAVETRAQIGNTGIDTDRSSGMRQGTNTVVGQVVFPAGYQTNRRCTVRLSSVWVGEFSTLTDDDGVFTFRRLREGSYFITVEAGKEFQPAQETVDLYDNRGRTVTVQIELRLRPNTIPKPAVLNASLVGVPKAAIDLYQKGVMSSAAGDFKKAIEQLQGAVAIYPAFVLALNELSAAHVNLNQLNEAAAALVVALKFEPSNSTLRLNYGYVLMLENKFADAEPELQRSVQINDKSAVAHLYRGRVLIRLAKLAEAETELKRAQALGGDSGILAYRYLGALYSEQGQTAKAVEVLETYLKLRPHAKDAEEIRKILAQLREQTPTKSPVTPL